MTKIAYRAMFKIINKLFKKHITQFNNILFNYLRRFVMENLAKIFVAILVIVVIVSCWGCHPSPINRAYISITNQPLPEDEDAGGLGDLGGDTDNHDYQEVKIDIAGGEMLPERYLQFKSEEGRLRNIATARRELDSAILKGDFEKVEKLQFIINRLNFYGNNINMMGMTMGYDGGKYGRPIPATNKTMVPVGVINNSSRVIKISKPLNLAGIELGPGEQTPMQIPVTSGLNQISYTEYELGRNHKMNRTLNVYVSEDTKNLTISDR